MNIGELLHSVEPHEIVVALETVYPEERARRSDYERALADLRSLQPLPTRFLCRVEPLETAPHGGTEPDDVHVCCREPGSPHPYAIDFIPWRECLSMDVEVAPELGPMLPYEILAHVLYELTYEGYFDSETAAIETERTRAALAETVEEIAAEWTPETPTLH